MTGIVPKQDLAAAGTLRVALSEPVPAGPLARAATRRLTPASLVERARRELGQEAGEAFEALHEAWARGFPSP